ncbi:MAG: hypothetical protein IJR85_10180 [Synergistaceae bacterium]|nr:hypothetical protein [Synergistaceae bacterium]
MDTIQEINKIEQAGQDSFEASDLQKSENLLGSFLGDCNEEERKVIDEFSQTLGIRTNDAIRAFVKLFFSFNRANNNLPKLINDAIGSKKDEIIDCIKQLAASAGLCVSGNFSPVSDFFYRWDCCCWQGLGAFSA